MVVPQYVSIPQSIRRIQSVHIPLHPNCRGEWFDLVSSLGTDREREMSTFTVTPSLVTAVQGALTFAAEVTESSGQLREYCSPRVWVHCSKCPGIVVVTQQNVAI